MPLISCVKQFPNSNELGGLKLLFVNLEPWFKIRIIKCSLLSPVCNILDKFPYKRLTEI